MRLYEVFESKDYIFLLTEYLEGGSLVDIIMRQEKVSEDELRNVFAQLLLGVDFMHRNKIVHRDIKPENILIKQKVEKKEHLSNDE